MVNYNACEGARLVLSCINVSEVLYKSLQWHVNPAGDHGFTVYAAYSEMCVVTGQPSMQPTRKWYLPNDSSASDVVRTAHKLLLGSLEHRLGEHFTYRGAKVYNPHVDVTEGVTETAKETPNPQPTDRELIEVFLKAVDTAYRTGNIDTCLRVKILAHDLCARLECKRDELFSKIGEVMLDAYC